MSSLLKYPRTKHLPWSEGATNDDKILESTLMFEGKEVVVSAKMDGECISAYPDYIHARSLDSKNHPSRNWVKELHSRIKHDIPKDWRIVGENLFAKHSIHYHNLPSYFLVFAIYNRDICLDWDSTKEWCNLLGLHMVPELYRGIWDEDKVKACYTGTSIYGEQEGYVVRYAESFKYEEHRLGKFVRKNHVTTASHWMFEEIIKNGLVDNGSKS